MPGATSADPANLPPRKAEKALAEMDFPTFRRASYFLFVDDEAVHGPGKIPMLHLFPVLDQGLDDGV